MNRKLWISLVFAVVAIFSGLGFEGSKEDTQLAFGKSIAIGLDETADQATKDYYNEQWHKAETTELAYLGVAVVAGFIASALLLFGIRQSAKDKKQARYEVEERRHQELLAVARQTQMQAHQAHLPPSKPSMLYTNPKPKAPTTDEFLSEAQRLYKAGDINGAIFLLEMSDDPRAKRALARLQGMKK